MFMFNIPPFFSELYIFGNRTMNFFPPSICSSHSQVLDDEPTWRSLGVEALRRHDVDFAMRVFRDEWTGRVAMEAKEERAK